MPSRPRGPRALAALALPLGAALALAGAPAPARAEAPRADRPLGVPTPGPLRALFLDPPLADVRRGAAPALELRWWAANSWSVPTTLVRAGQSAEVQLDAQTDALSLTAGLGWDRLFPGSALAARLESAVEARLVRHWGGWTDGGIEAWHRLGAYEDFERPAHPRDAVALTLRTPGRPGAALTGPVTGLGDLSVRTWLRLAEGDGGDGDRAPWAVALRLDVKLPTGRPADLTGSGSLDVAMGFSASGPLLGWLTGHAQVTAGRAGALPAWSPLQPRRWPLAAEASLVARLGQDWALLLEDRLQSALFERGWRLVPGVTPIQGDAVMAVTRVQNQVSVGARWRAVTVWLSEDFMIGSRDLVGSPWFYDQNAPDVVLGIAVAR